jgi:hypothetical protein
MVNMNNIKTTGLKMETRFITPDDAQRILTEGSSNRPLNEKQIARHAFDMVNGLWEQTGEPIKFDDQGRLIDGQHRLNAVVKSRITIEFVVISGLSTKAQDTMDSGRKRSLGDQLAMRGYKNTNQMSAAITLLMSWESTGKPIRLFNRTNVQAIEWSENHSGIEASMVASDLARRTLHYPGGLAAAVHYRMSRISPVNADFFWKVLGDGKSVSGTTTILTLRERMIKAAIKKEGSAARMSDVYRAALTIRAWNAWIEGRDLVKLVWRPEIGEQFPILVHPEEPMTSEDFI